MACPDATNGTAGPDPWIRWLWTPSADDAAGPQQQAQHDDDPDHQQADVAALVVAVAPRGVEPHRQPSMNGGNSCSSWASSST
ncbi:hypothetical protein DF186_19985, partial [Enterococcus hirae]